MKLEEAMDLAKMVNWEYDIATDTLTFDDRFYALYGTTRELEGGIQMSSEKYAMEFVHPEDRHFVAEEVRKANEATSPGFLSHLEHRIIRRDGEIRHLIVRIEVIQDEEGRNIKTHGVNQDVTERKRAEEALKESEEKYRGVVERISDIIVVFDSNQEMTFISPSIEKVLGYSPEEFRGIELDHILDAGELKKVKENFRKAFKGVELEPFEIQAERKDGSIATIEANLRPIYMDERCTGVQAIAHDISERKEMEFQYFSKNSLHHLKHSTYVLAFSLFLIHTSTSNRNISNLNKSSLTTGDPLFRGVKCFF